VIASLAAGVGLTVAFSFAIMGHTRYKHVRRRGRAREAWAYAALAAVGLAASVAAVPIGITVLTSR
jgi:hypothetical protein